MEATLKKSQISPTNSDEKVNISLVSDLTSTSSSSPPQPPPPSTSKESALEYTWMLRPCEVYSDEYSDCKSFKDRFHQYWVHGEFRECANLKADYENCFKWTNEKDTEALEAVVESEKNRVKSRLKTHLANDVWQSRESPPEDWAKELPQEILQEYKNSFLELKAKEFREGIISLDDPDRKEYIFTGTRCNIL